MKLKNAHCPRCGSDDVACNDAKGKLHMHKCLTCGYDGTMTEALTDEEPTK